MATMMEHTAAVTADIQAAVPSGILQPVMDTSISARSFRLHVSPSPVVWSEETLGSFEVVPPGGHEGGSAIDPVYVSFFIQPLTPF